mgnify:FL=1
MSKKVLILSASPRKGGNSETLAREFAAGAAEKGHQVEAVFQREKNSASCRGCLASQKLGRCVMTDVAVEIAEKMAAADVLVFATPVYYYSVSGQLKTMLDRANPLFTADYAFRQVYLLAAAAEAEDHAVEGAQKAVEGWVECFEKASLAGVVFAGGVTEPGDVAGHPALEKARQMGAAI